MTDYNFTLKSKFDFYITVGMSTAAVVQGTPLNLNVPVMIETTAGTPRKIRLSTTDWGSAGIGVRVAPSIAESGGGATLFINVTTAALPGTYPCTVQGMAEGTFNSHSATVTVTVQAKPEPKKQDNPADNQQHQPDSGKTGTGPSFKTQVRPATGKAGKAQPMRHMSVGRQIAALLLTLTIVGATFFGMSAFLNHGNPFAVLSSLLPGSNGSTGSGSPGYKVYVGVVDYYERDASSNWVLKSSGPGDELVYDNGKAIHEVIGQVQGNTIVGYVNDLMGDHPATVSFVNGVMSGECVDLNAGEKYVFKNFVVGGNPDYLKEAYPNSQ